MSQIHILETDLRKFKDTSYDLSNNWKDRKKEEFYQKHINGTVELADGYIFHCHKLLELIEEANQLNGM